ncbi:nucleoid-associated protein [Pseudomonas moorei]|uniref:Nucleoid-associated protein YejK n=1 Tax=Pseudomonas moorei TaxID=395599 RepID=A0A1H1EF18_9PSED|nr:nucleoid-associated protein [Pseudomonas moorei]SDQ87385.1 Nucleoid-associated protein YejK [Pseudomonas moorei]
MIQDAEVGQNQTVEPKNDDLALPKIDVLFAITAALGRNTELTGSPFEAKTGTPWVLGDSTAQKFVEKIEERFRKKNKLHGFFSKTIWHAMPDTVRKLLAVECDHLTFTNSVMTLLKNAANEIVGGGLGGGHVVFIMYRDRVVNAQDMDEDTNHGRLLIVMVGNRSGFEFDDKLQPKSLTSIDINALRQAAWIDLNLFDVSYPENSGDAYLRFIQGQSRSEFFKSALGCMESPSNKASVDNIYKSIRDFFAENKISRTDRDKCLASVEAFLLKKGKDRKTVQLKEIQALVDRVLPEDSELLGGFCVFVNDKEYEISSHFEPTVASAVSGASVNVTDTSRSYECKLKVTSLGFDGSDRPVKVDKDFNYIRIPLDAASKKTISDLMSSVDETNG